MRSVGGPDDFGFGYEIGAPATSSATKTIAV
jgi:hypothetical protein